MKFESESYVDDGSFGKKQINSVTNIYNNLYDYIQIILVSFENTYFLIKVAVRLFPVFFLENKINLIKYGLSIAVNSSS